MSGNAPAPWRFAVLDIRGGDATVEGVFTMFSFRSASLRQSGSWKTAATVLSSTFNDRGQAAVEDLR
jgi:hypothetical protein